MHRKFHKLNYRLLGLGMFIISAAGCIIWTNPQIKYMYSSIVYDNKHRIITQSHTAHGYQSWLPLNEIPDEIQNITVLTEDKRFWFHPGIDPIAICRAISYNIQSRSINSGASTITQQLVRYVIIKPYSKSPPSLVRKIREAIMAIRLTVSTPKKQILEYYLNSMYFGHDVYGINTAAYRYFNKPVSQLSTAENALLISLIANPSAYDPIKYPSNTANRRNGINRTIENSTQATLVITEGEIPSRFMAI